MVDVSCTRGMKRRLAAKAETAEPPSKSSKAMQTSSLLLLEVAADTSTSFPVWDAIRSKQVDATWSISPYSISVHLTPGAATQESSTTSSNRGSAANVAQRSVVSCSICGILQSQIQNQAASQDASQAVSQDASCVLLSFSQGTQPLPCSCLLHMTPPDPTSAASLMVSLPLAILQPQPGVTTSMEIPSTTLSSISPSSKLQTRSQAPTPSGYRTKSSSSVHICDNFLLGTCNSGIRCRMHHTPYPFHWQLWSVTAHQWVDLPLRSQVLLERIYCDPDKEFVYLKDGQVRLTLDFDSLELDDFSKYDAIRRLNNSDSEVRNPYFPSKWKIYWWNNSKFEEYKKDLSDMLLKKMSDKETSCSFHTGKQEYKVDFTTMTQTNVSTGFQREVSYRPVFRSPRSMQPYLKTGIQLDSLLPDPHPSGSNFSVDPLEEFSSWYPPVWRRQTADEFSLLDVPFGSQAFQSVQNLFHKSLPETKVDVISIQQVQNLLHWDKYQRQKAHMQKQHRNSQEALERHLFHGTTKEAAEGICHNNFDPRVAGVNGNSHGFGCYFATSAGTSNDYTDLLEQGKVRYMFLAKVLVGKVSLGRHHYRRPPPLCSKTQPHILYDACVDSKDNPSIFVVFDSCQCYPYYLIQYKELPQEVDVQE
ncbi:protein mono-ADP-ribosyltransferase TIPARP-like [Xenentodon cancila]